MKKVAAFILTILYLSTSMGATVHLHFCMDRLVGWGLVDRGSKDCMGCGMALKGGMYGCSVGMKNCCHDEQKHLQSDHSQKPSSTWAEWNFMPIVAVLSQQAWEEPLLIAQAIHRPMTNGPPLSVSIPIFLRNCNFRIWSSLIIVSWHPAGLGRLHLIADVRFLLLFSFLM